MANRTTKVYWSLSSLLFLTVLVTYLYGKWDRENSRTVTKTLRIELYFVISFVCFLGCRYCWIKTKILFKDRGSLGKMIQSLLFLVLIGAQVCFVCCFLILSAAEPHPLSIMCTLCFVTVLFFFLLLVFTDIIVYGCKRLVPFTSEGKQLELKIRLSLLMLISVTLTLYGYHNTTPIINRVDVNIKDLHRSLDGFNIVQISDIHLGPTVGRTQLKMIVDKINTLHPDIVVITGDLIDSSIEYISEAVEPLKDIQSKHGVYFAPGNHDYYSGDLDKWLVRIKELGVTGLMNERVFVAPGGDKSAGFYLAGLEDYMTKLMNYGTHGIDFKHALSGREEGIPTIVLAHQPSAALEAIEWKDVRLVLSGHTHAGQFFPANMFIYLMNPFFVGLYQPKENVFVYVSPGTQYFLFPIRHFFDPEITNIFLHNLFS